MKTKSIDTQTAKFANWAASGFLFIIISCILYKSPLISDDFEFANYGYAKLSQVIPYVLYYGNGRLLGNVGGVWLINFPLICAMIKSAVICSIIGILPKCMGLRDVRSYSVFSALFLLGINPDIFGQVFTWTSGFMNFVPPVLIMLSCVMLINTSKK